MNAGEHGFPLGHWTSKPAGDMARLFAWGESFILIPLHLFWVLSKCTPFVVDNTLGALAALVPFAVVLALAAAAKPRAFRAFILRLEWLFHLTAAILTTFLLVYVAFRDPFNPGVPISWPFCFWSVCLSFTLLSNLAMNERLRGAKGAVDSRKRWGAAITALAGWGTLLWLAGTVTWAPYLWSASIVFHAMMAPVSRRACAGIGAPAIVHGGRLDSATALAEGLGALALTFTAMLRFVFVCEMAGAAEARYIQFANIGLSPWFLAGALLALATRRLPLAVVFHALVVSLFLFHDHRAMGPIPLAIGYGLVVLFFACGRQGTLAWVFTAIAAAAIWVIGLSGFTMAGLIVVHKMGLDFTQRLSARMHVLTPLLFALWLVLAVLDYRRSRRFGGVVAEDAPATSRAACVWVYASVWVCVLAPLCGLIIGAMWPVFRLECPPRVRVGEPSGVCHAGYSCSDEEYAALHDLGVGFVRIPFSWNQIQPEPATWDFSITDAFVEGAQRHTMRVVAVLAFDNNAVEQSPDGATRNCFLAPDDFPLFEEYIRRIVERYRDRVYAWEIWNEPDLPHFWSGTMPEFYEVARHAARTVRETAPEARVLGTAMSSMYGQYSAAGIEGLHASGALELVDHPTMHTYVSDPRAYYGEFLRVRNAAAKYGHGGSIWVTELGIPDGGVYPWCSVGDSAAEHALKAYAIATSMGIETVLWHCFQDAPLETLRTDPLNSEWYFGLVQHEGHWKPAAHAYHLFAKHCSGSAIRSDLVDVSGGIAARQLRAVLFRRDDGRSALIVWFEPGLRRHARARVEVNLGELDEPAMRHSIGSNQHKNLVHGMLDVGEEPVFLTFDAPTDQTPIRLAVQTSPADAAWLGVLVALVAWSAVQSWVSFGRSR